MSLLKTLKELSDTGDQVCFNALLRAEADSLEEQYQLARERGKHFKFRLGCCYYTKWINEFPAERSARLTIFRSWVLLVLDRGMTGKLQLSFPKRPPKLMKRVPPETCGSHH